MRYLKTFEELHPDTYRSAADKLAARGETERAKALTDYIESPFFKHYIDRFRRSAEFREYIDDLKKDPEMKKILTQINPNSDIKEIYTLIKQKSMIAKVLEEEAELKFPEFSPEEKKARIIRALKRFGVGTLVASGIAIALIATGNAEIAGLHDVHNMSQMVDASIASFVTALVSNALFQGGMAIASRPKDEEPLSEKDI